MDDLRTPQRREAMVSLQIAGRGIRNAAVLEAMRAVPREAFVPEPVREFAYDDAPLPIAAGQTISQPYIVALMIDALGLEGGETVLEIGAGSGYAAAVVGRIAANVYAVERIDDLARGAAETIARLGIDNVHIVCGDGTLGLPEHAPYDAIIVSAGGPAIPPSLRSQLKIGGALVMPVGDDPRVQELVRVTRLTEDEYATEDIADVHFVPLVGDEGWDAERIAASSEPPERAPPRRPSGRPAARRPDGILDLCEPFGAIRQARIDGLLERIGDARVVLLGEASHGTAEFYRMRARITQALIERKGFRFVAIEADWPDAARIDHYVRHAETPPSEWTAFARFPVWMWRNREVREFVDWLRAHNAPIAADRRVTFHGLDLYSLHHSIRAVLDYLDDVDPEAARAARERYGCLTPWQADPATYGRATLRGTYEKCERQVIETLKALMDERKRYAEQDGGRFLDAVQNARLVAAAERYYRIMYYGSRASWNLRDTHMFETLETLLAFHGRDSRGVVWAHNSHLGDSAATEMSARGEINLGHLCREALGDGLYAIGFGTDHGTVAAASDWDGPLEIKDVRPAVANSYERICHDSSVPRFLLPLRTTAARDALSRPRLERAIGVIYRPETELQSHYFEAHLPRQFDEWIWFDETSAVAPLTTDALQGVPETYPFGV